MYTHKLNHIQVAVDIFVANNHGNQKYSESYRNDFDTWLKHRYYRLRIQDWKLMTSCV